MLEITVAERYANALLQIGSETDNVQRFADDLAGFVKGCAAAPELLPALSHPGFSPEERMNVLNAVLASVELHTVSANFLRVVLEKGRISSLATIVDSYVSMADKAAGRARANVVTAVEMDAATRDQVRDILQTLTGKTIVVEPSVDPEILGGMIAEIDGQIYDASLRARLVRVRHDLLSANPELAPQA